MASEGVGSYWPFATGKKIKQANLLIQQFKDSNKILNVLCPVKHIGVWEVGFVPQWLMREYLTRRGGKFTKKELTPAHCLLLGYSLKNIVIEGLSLRRELLNVEEQQEVGTEGYEAGSKILTDFFKKELKQFLVPELDPTGIKIIECFMDNGKLQELEELIPCESIFEED